MAFVSLILGGARSGKSSRALALANQPRRIFIATAEALDDEMAERIGKHKTERGPGWCVVEEPLELAAAIRNNAAQDTVLVIDCLTLWLSNLMHQECNVEVATRSLTGVLAGVEGRVVLVSNELGLGLAPDNALGRAFRDEQGRLNQAIAVVADHVEFVAAGLPIVLKGAPPGGTAR